MTWRGHLRSAADEDSVTKSSRDVGPKMGSAPHSGQQVQLFECSLLGLVSNGALPTLLDRLVAVCGDVRRGVKPDFEEHEIAFGPAAAPSFEGGKADDLMVRLRSSCLDPNTGERIVNLEHREWWAFFTSV